MKYEKISIRQTAKRSTLMRLLADIIKYFKKNDLNFICLNMLHLGDNSAKNFSFSGDIRDSISTVIFFTPETCPRG